MWYPSRRFCFQRSAGSAKRPAKVPERAREMNRKAKIAPAEEEAEREFREWIRRYEPVERAVYEERARRGVRRESVRGGVRKGIHASE